MKRFLYKQLVEHVDKRQISLVIGARQVGKTTLLKQLQLKLKTDNKSVHYFSLEDIEILDLLDQTPKNLMQLIERPDINRRVYVLIDEIQYLKNPSNFLKYHYDLYDNQIKFIVSGSSSFYIDSKFRDSLAGRKRIFELPVMSLKEVLYFKGENKLIPFMGKKDIPLLYRDRINSYFYEYLIYGGYPEVVLADSLNEKKKILKELAESYAKKDALESELTHPKAYLNLLKLLSARAGNLLNAHSLTSDVEIDVKTIQKYVWVMQKSFHLKLIYSFQKNISSEIRKMPKVYFCDLGLRNSFINNFSPIALRADKGVLLENYIFMVLEDNYGLDNVKFWRTNKKQEVDFVVQDDNGMWKAFEVKYSLDSFNRKKYNSFFANYPDIPFSVIDLQSAISI